MSTQASIESSAFPMDAMGKSMIRRPWLLTIVLASALCIAYLVAAVAHWGEAADRSLYANLGMIPIGLAATLLAAEAAKSRSSRRSTWAWAMLAAGLGCFWAGDVLYFVYQNVFGSSPFPSPADAGYLAYYPLAFIGLLCLPSQPAHRRRRSVTYPSCLVLVGGGAAAIFVWFLLPTLHSSRDNLFAYCLSVGYPFGDLLLLGGIAWMLLRGAWVNQWSIWLRCPWPWWPLLSARRLLGQARYAARRGPGWLIREPKWWWRTLRGCGPIWRQRAPVAWRAYRRWLRLLRRPESLS